MVVHYWLAVGYYFHKALPQYGVGVDEARNGRLAEISAQARRIWLVLSHDQYVDPQGLVRRWFDDHSDCSRAIVSPVLRCIFIKGGQYLADHNQEGKEEQKWEVKSHSGELSGLSP